MPGNTPRFISEPITPLDQSFDAARMAAGEPGVPHRFRWRQQEIAVAAVLEGWREFGDCAHGSGERYLRRHCYRLQTVEGPVMTVAFQRSFGRDRFRRRSRWRLLQIDA